MLKKPRFKRSFRDRYGGRYYRRPEEKRSAIGYLFDALFFGLIAAVASVFSGIFLAIGQAAYRFTSRAIRIALVTGGVYTAATHPQTLESLISFAAGTTSSESASSEDLSAATRSKASGSGRTLPVSTLDQMGSFSSRPPSHPEPSVGKALWTPPPCHRLDFDPGGRIEESSISRALYSWLDAMAQHAGWADRTGAPYHADYRLFVHLMERRLSPDTVKVLEERRLESSEPIELEAIKDSFSPGFAFACNFPEHAWPELFEIE